MNGIHLFPEMHKYHKEISSLSTLSLNQSDLSILRQSQVVQTSTSAICGTQSKEVDMTIECKNRFFMMKLVSPTICC